MAVMVLRTVQGKEPYGGNDTVLTDLSNFIWWSKFFIFVRVVLDECMLVCSIRHSMCTAS